MMQEAERAPPLMPEANEAVASEATPRESSAPGSEAVQDSMTFSRCAACRHSDKVDIAAGTLVCTKHSMLCDAEDDAIPDDCVEFEPDAEGPG